MWRPVLVVCVALSTRLLHASSKTEHTNDKEVTVLPTGTEPSPGEAVFIAPTARDHSASGVVNGEDILSEYSRSGMEPPATTNSEALLPSSTTGSSLEASSEGVVEQGSLHELASSVYAETAQQLAVNDVKAHAPDLGDAGSAVNDSAAGTDITARQVLASSRKRVNCSSRFSDVPFAKRMLSGANYGLNFSEVAAGMHDAASSPEEAEWEAPTTASIMHVNNSQLAATFKQTASETCTFLILYAPWCPFCARFAPHLNAASRAFPDLRFIAVNGATLNSLNSKYATVAVPNVVLFQGQGKFLARFNYTEKNFQSLVWFIQNVTNLTALSEVDVGPADYEGPLSAQAMHEPDYYLHASWFVLVFVTLYYINAAGLLTDLVQKLRSAAGHEHLHAD